MAPEAATLPMDILPLEGTTAEAADRFNKARLHALRMHVCACQNAGRGVRQRLVWRGPSLEIELVDVLFGRDDV